MAAVALLTAVTSAGAQTTQVDEGSAAPAALSGAAIAVLAIAACAGVLALLRVKWFHVKQTIGPRWPLPATLSLAGFLGAFVVGTLAVQLAYPFVDPGAEDAPKLDPLARSTVIALVMSVVQLGWVIVLLWYGRDHTRKPEALVKRAAPLGESIGLMLVAMVLSWPVIVLIAMATTYMQQRWSKPAPHLGHDTLQQMAVVGTKSVWFWVSAGMAMLVAPCVEEPINRGFVQQGLKAVHVPRSVAVLGAAIIFAMLHWTALPENARLPGITTLALLGLLWGWLYERTGRLSVCIAAHALFNAMNLWPLIQGG